MNILSRNDLRLARAAVRTLLPAMILSLVLASPSRAQSLHAGDLSGIAKDRSGRALPEVSITLTEEVTGVVRTRLTPRNGHFAFSLLQPGNYRLLVERFGYRPRLMIGLPVRTGTTIDLAVVLDDTDPNSGIDTTIYGGVAAGALRLTLGQGAADAFASLSDPAGLVTGAASVLPAGSADFTVDGLPGRRGAFAPDAALRRSPRHALLPSAWLDGAAFPQAFVHGVELMHGGMDIEWPGSGGALVAGNTIPGSRALSTTITALGGPATQSGSIVVGGPAVRDTAQFVFGLAASRLAPQLDAPWGTDSLATRYAAIAQDSFTRDLTAYQRTYKPTLMNLAGFGRFDWLVARDHRLMLRANAATSTWDDEPLAPDVPATLGARAKVRDLSIAMLLTSTLGTSVGNELGFGFDAGSRDYQAPSLAGTWFTDAGLSAGASNALPGTFKRTSVRVGDTGHIRFSHGSVKFGVQLRLNSFNNTFADNRRGTFFFGDSLHFAADSGAFVQTVGATPLASFRNTEAGFFVQAQLRPTASLQLTGGFRYDLQTVPVGDLRGNSDWLKLTGIDNRVVPKSRSLISPRARLEWTPSASRAWMIALDAGRFLEADDPGALSEALAYATGISVRRGVGALGGWPGVPDSTVAPVQGATLTLLGPRYSPPVTSRAGVGLTGNVRGANLRLEFAYRHTDFLPIRRDLNLSVSGNARDQDGRELFGTLTKVGGLVVATPGTNRRFSSFDQVFTLDPAAASNNVNLTVAFDRMVGGGLHLLAEYTWSKTTDNWFGARAASLDGQVLPLADSTGFSAWAKGRSDFDVPHHLVLGLSIPIRGAALTALYRLRSGYPFTPGFRDGVDMNGDGSGRNDPAFVSDTVAGAADVINGNACLRTQVGQISERNSCRDPIAGALDLRLSVPLRHNAQLLVDVMNAIATGQDVMDHALYLVDPAAPLVTAGSVTRVPLLANPNFGKTLWKRTPGILFRAGVRIAL